MGVPVSDVLSFLPAHLLGAGTALGRHPAPLLPEVVGPRSGGLLLPGLLAAGDCLLLALPGTGVGLRALPVHGQPAAVADALVAADLDLAADVGLHLAAQVALYLVGCLDPVPQPDELIVAERVHAGVPADAGRLQRLERTSPADSVDIGQGDLEALVAREVDADETCHPG